MMERFNRQEGVNRIRQNYCCGESAERRYRLRWLISDYSYPQILNYCRCIQRTRRQAGCSTKPFWDGALAGFLWWISGGIPSLSVQNRKKHLHRSEPYDEADGGIAGELAGQTLWKAGCCGRRKQTCEALAPAGANRKWNWYCCEFAPMQLKLREIAQITGLPLRTVQSRLRRPLKT